MGHKRGHGLFDRYPTHAGSLRTSLKPGNIPISFLEVLRRGAIHHSIRGQVLIPPPPNYPNLSPLLPSSSSPPPLYIYLPSASPGAGSCTGFGAARPTQE